MESVLAANGYASASQTTASPRGVEYQVFSRVTRELSQAKDLEKKDFPKRAAAIHRNMRLWTLIAADVALESNGLPADLRSKLFYLSEFTRQHSNKVLAGEAELDPLIDINLTVMQGLRGAPQAEQGPA